VMPGAPATPLTTLVKPVFTSVTHVAAEAEDNSAAFRLATLTPIEEDDDKSCPAPSKFRHTGDRNAWASRRPKRRSHPDIAT
jgi:hypothetical protein